MSLLIGGSFNNMFLRALSGTSTHNRLLLVCPSSRGARLEHKNQFTWITFSFAFCTLTCLGNGNSYRSEGSEFCWKKKKWMLCNGQRQVNWAHFLSHLSVFRLPHFMTRPCPINTKYASPNHIGQVCKPSCELLVAGEKIRRPRFGMWDVK